MTTRVLLGDCLDVLRRIPSDTFDSVVTDPPYGTPPGGLVLDPFAGSGTTGLACDAEGFRCLLIEQDAHHVEIIRSRLAKAVGC